MIVSPFERAASITWAALAAAFSMPTRGQPARWQVLVLEIDDDDRALAHGASSVLWRS
jgi:hypothetical protein